MSFVLGGPTPGMAGLVTPLRALHIELSSTAKRTGSYEGDDGRDFGVPSGTFCEEVPMIPEGLSWGV